MDTQLLSIDREPTVGWLIVSSLPVGLETQRLLETNGTKWRVFANPTASILRIAYTRDDVRVVAMDLSHHAALESMTAEIREWSIPLPVVAIVPPTFSDHRELTAAGAATTIAASDDLEPLREAIARVALKNGRSSVGCES